MYAPSGTHGDVNAIWVKAPSPSPAPTTSSSSYRTSGVTTGSADTVVVKVGALGPTAPADGPATEAIVG